MSIRRRRLINDPSNVVSEMLEGYAAANRHVIRLDEHGNVLRAQPKETGKVGLVIGNGSGHEPAMIGWVGPGLFDVNVPGPVFTAPGPSRLLSGIRAADRDGGVLLCVSHHAGDLLNARQALEAALDLGLNVEMVILYDDISSAPKGREKERRGGAGLFFVWKIVGALAESGGTLAQCSAMAERVRDSTRSLTAAFGTVAHPVSGEPLASLDRDDFVIGVGVHGESGTQVPGAVTADDVATRMTNDLIEDAELRAGDRACVLLSNSGALTVMELSVIYRSVNSTLRDAGIDRVRMWMGSYATTQDLAGFALALCRVDDIMLRLYDAPALGAAFNMAPADPVMVRT